MKIIDTAIQKYGTEKDKQDLKEIENAIKALKRERNTIKNRIKAKYAYWQDKKSIKNLQ